MKLLKNIFWIIITIIQLPFFIVGILAYLIAAPIITGWSIAEEVDGENYKKDMSG